MSRLIYVYMCTSSGSCVNLVAAALPGDLLRDAAGPARGRGDRRHPLRYTAPLYPPLRGPFVPCDQGLDQTGRDEPPLQ